MKILHNDATAWRAGPTDKLPLQSAATGIREASAEGVARPTVSSSAAGHDRKLHGSPGRFYSVDAWPPRNSC